MFLSLYSLVMDWVFPLQLSCRIEALRIWEHLMYVLPCLSVVTMGYHVIHLMYVLVINLRVPPMNLCIGVGTRFRLDSLVESLGHSLKYFCVGWIDESEIVWCISYNHTHRYLRWQWSIYVTLGFLLICVLRFYSSMNSWIRSIRKNNFEVVSYPTIISSFVLCY